MNEPPLFPSMNSFLARSLALGLFASPAGALWAQGASGDPHGRPEDLEARPPLHIRPFLSSSPSGYTVAQVRHAYGFDTLTGNGAGQTIAIVDAYGSATVQSDLDVFCARMGVAPTTVDVRTPQGKAPKNSGWALETSLDVQWAHAIAPGAKIMLVVAKSASLGNLLDAVDYAARNGASQISMSWGASEFSSEKNYDSYFQKSGVTYIASSGDNGAGVSWPAASPYVVAVGGTNLQLDAAGNVLNETAWSGSGGGISVYQTRPGYQGGWNTASGRGVPDVSYNADPNTGVPVYISNYNGSTGWVTVGGTSAGAPQWAAAIALVNAARTTALSGTNGALYALANANYSNYYRDIVVGTNGYTAVARYDYVTGLGSPLAATLVTALKTAP
jgi:subtilase family serine protease